MVIKNNWQIKFDFSEGSLIGFLTGLIGAGGGFIIIPILVILSNLE